MIHEKKDIETRHLAEVKELRDLIKQQEEQTRIQKNIEYAPAA